MQNWSGSSSPGTRSAALKIRPVRGSTARYGSCVGPAGTVEMSLHGPSVVARQVHVRCPHGAARRAIPTLVGDGSVRQHRDRRLEGLDPGRDRPRGRLCQVARWRLDDAAAMDRDPLRDDGRGRGRPGRGWRDAGSRGSRGCWRRGRGGRCHRGSGGITAPRQREDQDGREASRPASPDRRGAVHPQDVLWVHRQLLRSRWRDRTSRATTGSMTGAGHWGAAIRRVGRRLDVREDGLVGVGVGVVRRLRSSSTRFVTVEHTSGANPFRASSAYARCLAPRRSSSRRIGASFRRSSRSAATSSAPRRSSSPAVTPRAASSRRSSRTASTSDRSTPFSRSSRRSACSPRGFARSRDSPRPRERVIVEVAELASRSTAPSTSSGAIAEPT